MSFSQIVIIGAPRSGTNMLRDVLTSLDGFGTWPCDEINYIWRHGNIKYPTDEFTRKMATPPVQNFIRKAFTRLAQRFALNTVVEKTCANTLRIPFVDRVLPDARYVYIYRDGIDAAGSAMKRWTATLDLPYILRKARYVPPSDLPYYAGRYFFNRAYRLWSREERLAFWGPLFSGYKQVLQSHSLPEVCAWQWKCCVDQAEKAFQTISPERVVRVRYETFVKNPVNELERIAQHLGLSTDSGQLPQAVKNVSDRSIGKGRDTLAIDDVRKVRHLIKDSLERYGY